MIVIMNVFTERKEREYLNSFSKFRFLSYYQDIS